MPEPDARPWVKVSVDYFDNPKIDDLTDQAQLLHLMLIVKSGQKMTDGIVSERLANSKGRKPLRELTTAGLLHKRPDGKYVVHDYEKHQTIRAELEQITDKRRAAGAIGGRKSNHVRNHEGRDVRDPGCEFCYPDGPPLQSEGPIPF